MKTNSAALAKIHIARKELALNEETYRAVLERVTGRNSAAGISDALAGRVLDEFRRMGWTGKKPFNRSPRPVVRKIFAQWNALAPHLHKKNGSRESLRAFVKRLTGVSDPNFLDGADANKVIEALKAWQTRHEQS